MSVRKVARYGATRGFVKVEDGSTKGATVGKNLFWSDGSLVSASELTGSGSTSEELSPGEISPSLTLWSLIQNIPQWILNLAALDTDPSRWPMVKNKVENGEQVTVAADYQLLVFDSMTVDAGGVLTVNGDLVVL